MQSGGYGKLGTASGQRVSWVYWLVAVLALLWNGFGCVDFAMTAMRMPEWLANMPPEVINWLDAAPSWPMWAWAVGVGSGFLGSLALLFRSNWASFAFALSLCGLAVNHYWQWTSDMPVMMKTTSSIGFAALIWAVTLGLLIYSLKQSRKGTLR